MAARQREQLGHAVGLQAAGDQPAAVEGVRRGFHPADPTPRPGGLGPAALIARTPAIASDAWSPRTPPASGSSSARTKLLAVEHSLPHVEEDLEEQAEAVREHYDEQILAALIAPSF